MIFSFRFVAFIREKIEKSFFFGFDEQIFLLQAVREEVSHMKNNLDIMSDNHDETGFDDNDNDNDKDDDHVDDDGDKDMDGDDDDDNDDDEDDEDDGDDDDDDDDDDDKNHAQVLCASRSESDPSFSHGRTCQQ